MIERYIDTKRLLMDLENIKKEVKRMKIEYDSIDGSRSIDYSRVRGGSGGDMMNDLVYRRISLMSKIEEYERDLAIIDNCINELEKDEQTALREFFMTDQSKTAAVSTIRDKLHIEQSAAYDLRRRAKRNFDNLLLK